MGDLANYRKAFLENGFTVIEHVFSDSEIEATVNSIEQADTSKVTFRKSVDLFAIRQFLKEVPQVLPLIFVEKLNSIISNPVW